MLIEQGVLGDFTIEIDSVDRSGDKILDQCKTFNPEQKKVIFETLFENRNFFEAAVVSLSFDDHFTIRYSGNVAGLCINLSRDEKKEISGLLIKQGLYNVAAELVESDRDPVFKDRVYEEISMYGAEKNDIFLVRQFAGSMHDVQKKDAALERAAKIIAVKGPHWIGESDLKAITQLMTSKEKLSKVLNECKELIADRKV